MYIRLSAYFLVCRLSYPSCLNLVFILVTYCSFFTLDEQRVYTSDPYVENITDETQAFTFENVTVQSFFICNYFLSSCSKKVYQQIMKHLFNCISY